MAKQAVPAGPRNRVVERRRMRSEELTANPRNWREHPEAQRAALRGVLGEVGQVGELYAYRSEREGGKLVLIDGHMRLSEAPEWDVAITDLTDEEADLILAVRDPIGAMAQSNAEALAELLSGETASEEGLASLIASLRGEAPERGETKVKPVEVRPPPAMTWALVGLPTTRWGEVAEAVERLAKVPGIFCEVCANDAKQQA